MSSEQPIRCVRWRIEWPTASRRRWQFPPRSQTLVARWFGCAPEGVEVLFEWYRPVGREAVSTKPSNPSASKHFSPITPAQRLRRSHSTLQPVTQIRTTHDHPTHSSLPFPLSCPIEIDDDLAEAHFWRAARANDLFPDRIP